MHADGSERKSVAQKRVFEPRRVVGGEIVHELVLEEARENSFRIHANAPPLETVLELSELTIHVASLAEKRGIVLNQAADLDGEVLAEPGDTKTLVPVDPHEWFGRLRVLLFNLRRLALLFLGTE